MLQVPQDKLIVTVKTKYIKNFSEIAKRAAIADNASVHLEDLVNIVGEIVSLPNVVSDDRWHKGFTTKDMQVGDVVIFSHSVIYDWYQNKHMGDPLYKNLISIHGKEYWMADITKVYAVIRNNETIMVNGYVMATPFEEDKIFVTAAHKKIKGVKSSTVMYVGNAKEGNKKISAKQGDTIYYSPKYPIKYQINDKPFIILQQHQILGTAQ